MSLASGMRKSEVETGKFILYFIWIIVGPDQKAEHYISPMKHGQTKVFTVDY